jgi:hypothetical protein
LETILQGKPRANKKEILLERLSLESDSILRGREQISSQSFEEIQLSMCQIFMGRNTHKEYERTFAKTRHHHSQPIQEFLTMMVRKWQQYQFALTAQNKDRKPESDFLDYFLKMLDPVNFAKLESKIVKQKVVTILQLQKYVHDWVELFDKHCSDDEDDTKAELAQLKKEISQLRRKEQQTNAGIHNMQEHQQSNQSQAAQTSDTRVNQQLQQTQTNNTLLQDTQIQNQRTLQATQTQLLTMMQGFTSEARNDRFSYQKQLNDMHASRRDMVDRRDQRDRSRSPHSHRYQGENRQQDNKPDYQQSYQARGRERGFPADQATPDRGRSRSHSPTPKDTTCFACGEGHWIINCTYSTRVERELELIKVLQKLKDNGSFTPEREAKLRDNNNIPVGKRNRYLDHDQTRQPQGTGTYCKWCHIRGHSTWICNRFCCICETEGHGWETCTSNPQLVATRQIKYKNLLSRMKFYDTPSS